MPSPLLHVLTVSELTTRVRHTLEQEFSDVWVEGEVSTLRLPSSGHIYFTLKDNNAQIRAVLFRNVAHLLRFALQDGLLVIVRGRVSVYEPRGDYQVILEYLEPKGIGALQLAFEQLKEKLEKEGLFDSSRKKPLPFLPKRVGLVTSLSGAALHDMMTVLRRRCPVIHILIHPVPVQGEGAADHIAEAIYILNKRGLVDVMIVGRGGGSWEDLWCFNEEVVVRAIAESSIPIVSAVGHEIDFTLTDFAADYRAPTPSVAAEAVSPVLEELIGKVLEKRSRLVGSMRSQLTFLKREIHRSSQRVPSPGAWVQRRMQRLDEVEHRLCMVMNVSTRFLRSSFFSLMGNLNLHSPQKRIQQIRVLVPQLQRRLHQELPKTLTMRRQQFQKLAGLLESLNPLAVLTRGYSILETYPGGQIIRSVREVESGEQVRSRLADGNVLSTIKKVERDFVKE